VPTLHLPGRYKAHYVRLFGLGETSSSKGVTRPILALEPALIMDMTPIGTHMNEQWTEFATAIKTSEPDQVNEVIDDIKDMDLGERIELFDVCFDELTGIYAGAASVLG
jgi:hypothetical protein